MIFSNFGFVPNVANVQVLAKYELSALIIFGNNALKHFSFSLSLAVSVCLSRCLNACTYCKTKHARGDLASYPIDELVERTRQSFQGEYTHRNITTWLAILVIIWCIVSVKMAIRIHIRQTY